MDSSLIDLLAMQLEWGADEALDEAPVDRRLQMPAIRAAAGAVPGGDGRSLQAGGASLVARPGISVGAIAAGSSVERARAAAALCDSPDAIRATLAKGALVPELAALRTTASSLVLGEGNAAAGLVLVGEVPGADEDRAGRPFVGPAGQLLDRMLASIELDRTQLLMLMLVPWRPPGGRAPSEAEVAACLPFLQRHLALLKPMHLVVFGNLALRTVAGHGGGLRRMRGKWLQTIIPGVAAPTPTLPMLPPALLISQPACKREAWSDLLSLRARLDATPRFFTIT